LGTNLAVTATPAQPAGATNVVFVLEYQGGVLVSRTSPPPYAVTFTNLAAGKYFLTATLAGPGTPPNGNVSFDINAASAAPANDQWSQATVLPGLNTTVISTNTAATREPGEPVHGGLGTGKSVWWKWTAVSNGVYTATTLGSSFDTVLAIYTGTNLATLVQRQANDEAGQYAFSQATFLATNGMTYYFAVDSAAAAAGRAQLRLVAGGPPVITITAPTDGYLMLVATPTTTTNTTVTATITDPAGVARVDYWFDSASGISRSDILPPPYQLNLRLLIEGHYLLTLVASNNLGLISITNTGFSVISLAPLLVAEGFQYSSNRFQLGVTGFKGPNYTVQGSTNLEAWCAVTVFTNFAGAEKVTDTNAAPFKQRFYRAASQ
jgi:hypothetical protein